MLERVWWSAHPLASILSCTRLFARNPLVSFSSCYHNTRTNKTALANRLARARPGGVQTNTFGPHGTRRVYLGLSGSLVILGPGPPIANRRHKSSAQKAMREKVPSKKRHPNETSQSAFLHPSCRRAAGALQAHPRQIKPLQLCGQLNLQHKEHKATRGATAQRLRTTRAARNTTVSATVLDQARQWSTSPLQDDPR